MEIYNCVNIPEHPAWHHCWYATLQGLQYSKRELTTMFSGTIRDRQLIAGSACWAHVRRTYEKTYKIVLKAGIGSNSIVLSKATWRHMVIFSAMWFWGCKDTVLSLWTVAFLHWDDPSLTCTLLQHCAFKHLVHLVQAFIISLCAVRQAQI